MNPYPSSIHPFLDTQGQANLKLEDNRIEFCKYFLKKSNIEPDGFRWTIHPQDEMFYNAILPGIFEKNLQKAYLKYLESGKRSLDIIDQIVEHCYSRYANLPNFLEFACGHGRFTRYLVNRLPTRKIWTSDIYESAVDWQKKYFGVHAIQSCTNPEDFHCDEKFSLIFVGSLFSHLPDTLFKAWLRTLYDLLDEHGLLVFSVRDEDSLRKGETINENGFAFSRESESDTLSRDSYGLTHVTLAYVSKALNELDNNQSSANYVHFKKALYENQTLFVVSKNHRLNLPALRLKITPIGGVQKNHVTNSGQRVISGWGIDLNAGQQISEVELYVNDHITGRCKPVAGDLNLLKYFPKAPNDPITWSFVIDNKNFDEDSLVTCRLRSQSGAEIILFCN